MARLFLMLCLFSAATAAAAQPAAPVRTEVPIREVVLSDGARRYAVPVRVGQADVEVGLDTGSTGLRVLPGVIGPGDTQPGHRAEPYAFGSGVKLDGVIARTQVAIGALAGPVAVEAVQAIGCVAAKPHCPASRIAFSIYGIQGDGLPGEGFKALLGTNMGRADAENPLMALGARRWIVELPRPGEGAPGRLILNPADSEVGGFVFVPVLGAFSQLHGGLHDAVAGCLAKPDGSQRACGALLMDSGAPGISVHNGGIGSAPWPDGAPAALLFVDGRTIAAAEAIIIGQRAQASHLTLEDDPSMRGTAVYAGLTPYFAFSVLYDPEHGRIGLKARPAAPGGPRAAEIGHGGS